MPLGRGRIDLRLEHHEAEIEKQDRAGDAERVGDRIAHRRVVIAERRDGRLQRRRAGPRAREQAERIAEIQPHHLRDHQARDARQQHADQRDQIGPSAGRAGQAEEELLSVLHAHGIEEEREAERSDHRRRHRLRREPAHAERDEQHRADAERKALDVDLADQIADRDRQEERHQRLLLQHCPDEFHGRLPLLVWRTRRRSSLVDGEPPAAELLAHALAQLRAWRLALLERIFEAEPVPFVAAQLVEAQDLDALDCTSARRRCRPPSRHCHSRR